MKLGVKHLKVPKIPVYDKAGPFLYKEKDLKRENQNSKITLSKLHFSLMGCACSVFGRYKQ
jgi:hypothetical protein